MKTHRGFRIEPVDATQLGYRLSSGDPGKGRKTKSFFIYSPEDGQRPIKTVASMKAAIEYIDTYVGSDTVTAEDIIRGAKLR